MEVWWLRRKGKVDNIRWNIEAEPETEEALAAENLDLLIMIQILIIFNCCIVNKHKDKPLFALSLWIMCGMQVSIGETRLTWASVEPDSATF